MNAAGVPIHGDPVYPELLPAAGEDFGKPMMLTAVALAFRDPVTKLPRCFTTDGYSHLPLPERPFR